MSPYPEAKKTAISVRLMPVERQQLVALATDEERTLSQTVRRLLRRAVGAVAAK